MPARILLKTTIGPVEDDSHIGRFGLLAETLRDAGHDVTARNRVQGGNDPDLAALDAYDQLWLFAVDEGNGLTDGDAEAVRAFRARGGGLMLTRDHQDLGSSLLKLGPVGQTQCFQTANPEPDETRRCIDDIETAHITWPNYHSGANGDYQHVAAAAPVHPVARGIALLPAHPHEGAVAVPPALADQARVILTGKSMRTGRAFPIAVAVESGGGEGRALADSSFHHFADYNWDPESGCPSFVDEPCGRGIIDNAQAAAEARLYATNIAEWLARETG